MSSASSTDSRDEGRNTGLQPWHLYLLLAMLGATVAVVRATDTQPAALLLLSAAVIASGAVAIASHYALTGFFSDGSVVERRMDETTRQALEREKALVLRSIKELEFDHSMRKIGDADFEEIGGRLRERAMTLIEQLDRAPVAAPPVVASPRPRTGECPSCQTRNELDARFCKSCGNKL